MRISDWSSDVCSSDLLRHRRSVKRALAGAASAANSSSRKPIQQDRPGKCSLASVAAAHWRAVAPSQHNTSNSNCLQATGESVMRPELTGSSLGRVQDRKSVVEGTRESVSVDVGGRRIIKKKKKYTTNNTRRNKKDRMK